MSYASNIPVYVVFQTDENNEDDVDSLISFATGSSTNWEEQTLADAESRWALECTSSAVNLTAVQQHQRRREGPHHPERSLSYSSHNPNNANNNNNGSSPRNLSPVLSAARKARMPTRVTPKRATRLTRMAERAKAVARTPVARRRSFHRHSLPSIPIRKSSRCSSSLASSYHSSRTCHSSSLSPPHRCNSAMMPRRRNSIECVLPAASTSGGVGLESMLLRQAQQRSPVRGVRRSTGCFQIACAAANMNSPPRLPQRYPSEIMASN